MLTLSIVLVLVVVLVLERFTYACALSRTRYWQAAHSSFSWSKFEGETMHESNSVAHKLTAPFWAGILPTDSSTTTRTNRWLPLRYSAPGW